MTPTFDRIGYAKQILGSETSRAEKAVLLYFAIYCDQERTISLSQHTAKKMGPMLSMTNYTVGRTIQNLKDIGLLSVIERKRLKFHLLPNEEKLALYTPKK